MKKEDKDNQLTSISLDKTLYRNCKKKLLDDNKSFVDLINECIHMYLSGSVDIKKYKIEITGSL